MLWHCLLSCRDRDLLGRAVVVFDVLRATTTIVSALAAGAREVRVFGSLDEASSAASGFDGLKLLCGEKNCLPPNGFDLGNSPGDFSRARVVGRTVFMCTTNGTRAIAAAGEGAGRFVASLVNCGAMAQALSRIGLDITLLCAGTNGEVAPEDLIGAGAVIDRVLGSTAVKTTRTSDDALRLFRENRQDLPRFLQSTRGGRNVLDAGLGADIDFAARLDAFDIVAEVSGNPPIVRVMNG
jgi:2-phosphosulfolactate phosphatase